MTDKPFIPYEDALADDLRDDEYVAHYLNIAASDSDPKVLLLALRRVAKARNINMTEAAKKLDVSRRGLYLALSEGGNPEWQTLCGLLDMIGFQIQFTPKKAG